MVWEIKEEEALAHRENEIPFESQGIPLEWETKPVETGARIDQSSL